MPKFAANLTIFYHEHAFLDRFSAARHVGFEAMEFLFPRLGEGPPAQRTGEGP